MGWNSRRSLFFLVALSAGCSPVPERTQRGTDADVAGVPDVGESDADSGPSNVVECDARPYCGQACELCLPGARCESAADCTTRSCEEVCVDRCVGEAGGGFVAVDGLPQPAIDVDLQMVDARPILTSGVGLGDLNGDGALDIVVTNATGPALVLLQTGTRQWTDRTDSSLPMGPRDSTSVLLVDLDADGDLDLVMGSLAGVRAYVNDGSAGFSEVTEELGLGSTPAIVSATPMADYDGDGDLDLFVAAYTRTNPDGWPTGLANRLFRNDDGVFVPVDGPTSDGVAPTLAAAWVDVDANGYPDLWVVNDFGPMTRPNQLFMNDEGELRNEAGVRGYDQRMFGMSATVGDFDNDGDPDGYVTNIAGNVLLELDGGSAADIAPYLGVTAAHSGTEDDVELSAVAPGMADFIRDYTVPALRQRVVSSWASVFFDFDHDGWQDLYVSNGMVVTSLLPETAAQPSLLFGNDAGARFSQMPCGFIPESPASGRGAATGDIDGDGDLDLVWVDNGIFGKAGLHVAENRASAGDWLRVRLRGRPPNVEAIGASVSVTQASGHAQYRWIDGGQGFLSSNERIAHFGLGNADPVVRLAVTWPDGTTTVVTDAPAGAELVVEQ